MIFKHSIASNWVGFALTDCTMIPKYKRPVAPVAPQFTSGAETNAAPAAAVTYTDS